MFEDGGVELPPQLLETLVAEGAYGYGERQDPAPLGQGRVVDALEGFEYLLRRHVELQVASGTSVQCRKLTKPSRLLCSA